MEYTVYVCILNYPQWIYCAVSPRLHTDRARLPHEAQYIDKAHVPSMPIGRSTIQDTITKTARASKIPNTHVQHPMTIVHNERPLARNQ